MDKRDFDPEQNENNELINSSKPSFNRPTFSIEEDDEEDMFVYESDEVLPSQDEAQEEPAQEEDSKNDIRSILSRNRSENEQHTENEFSSMQPSPKKKLNVKKLLFSLVIVILLLLIFLVGKSLFTGKEQAPTPVDESFKTAENITVEKAIELTEKASEKSDTMNVVSSIPSIQTEEEKQPVSDEPITFEDNSLGISFTYPSDWVEIGQFQTKVSPSNVKNVIMVGYPPDSNILDNMRITVEATPVSITSKEYFRQTEERMKEIFPKFQSVNSAETTVSGREAPTRTYLWVPQSELDRTPYQQEWKRIKQYQVYVAGNTKIYLITFTSEDKTFDKNFKKYQEVLANLQLGE